MLGIFHDKSILKALSCLSGGHAKKAAETYSAQMHEDKCLAQLCSAPGHLAGLADIEVRGARGKGQAG